MAPSTDTKRFEMRGESISPGMAVGKAHLFKQIDLDALEKNRLPIEDITKEEERLDRAVEKSIEQLHQVLEQAGERTVDSVSRIFEVQMEFLKDKSFLDAIKLIMEKENANVEYILANQIRELERRFHTIEDEVIRTRFLDIQDAHQRILRNLLEIEHVRTNPFRRVGEPVVFISERLLPSDVALLDFRMILGIVVEEGSKVSHVAIISRSLGIPAISNIPGASSLVRPGDQVLVDGVRGNLIVHPNEADLAEYQKTRRDLVARKGVRSRQVECKTADGVSVRLLANVGSVREAEEAYADGAEGIGLLRPEFYYMSQSMVPTVEEECDFYRRIMAAMKRRPITIRLLDLGGDKIPAYLKAPEGENPLLGIRGIRYLLRNPELFHQHLRSILYASTLAPISILIPFVATIDDWNDAVEIIDQACTAERADRDRIRIGIMVEIPSAAMDIEPFLDRVDFVSIGTNDLVQYVFAVARDESELEQYRQNLHPVILRTILNIVESAAAHEKEVSICGEMAGDPAAACLLVGAGIRILSMQPTSVPAVRTAIRKWPLPELSRRFLQALGSHDLSENRELIATFAGQE